MAIETHETGRVEEVPRRGFLGWQIVATAFVAQFIANGLTFSTVGNFILPMSRDLGVSQTAIGIAPGLAIATMGVLGPFLGRGLDRGLARPLMCLGSVLAGLGLLGIARATQAWQVAVLWVGLVCVGCALFGALPSMTLVANWFARRRGLALGVTVAGATIASWVAPAAAQLVMDLHGWRTAVSAAGLVTLGVGLPVFACFVIGRPEAVGQRPDGDATPEPAIRESGMKGAGGTSPDGVRGAGELIRDPQLWLVAIGFGLVLSSPVVLIGLLVPFGDALGFSQQEATFFFAAMMPFSLAGKIVLGGLADVAPLKPSVALIVVANVLVWAILFSEPGYALFIATGALYGIGIGGAAPLQGVMVGRCFGRMNFGIASGLGGILGIPLLVGAQIGSQVMLGATGSYGRTFALQAGLLVLGGAMLLAVRIPPPETAGAPIARA